MSGYAIAKREMQFCAGPEHYTFYACAEHRPQLERGEMQLFFTLAGKPVEPVAPDDEVACDMCREG